MTAESSNDPSRGVASEDFLRALLNISPEDAAEVREATPGTRKPREVHRDVDGDDNSPGH